MKEKIMIIDDDPLICQGLSQALKDEYEVVSTTSGEEALEMVKKEDFDVVLTDLVMPKVGGMRILKEIKGIKPEIRVIMITAYATVENAIEALKEGATDYIPKPFDLDKVQKVVKRALKEARFERRRDVEQRLRIEGLKISTDKDSLFRSLSNPIRREAIEFLNDGEHSFTEITKELEIEDATKLSFHLRTLKFAGLIEQNEQKIYSLSMRGEEVAKILKFL